MANFPKFHGITLAANSWIENANFERLAADPVPVSAGRVWFNTTDKALKYSSLDANGAVVIRTIGNDPTYSLTVTSQLNTKLDKTEVTSVATANKVLRLDAGGKLPASITGNAATATNVDWSGVLNKPTTLSGYGITDAMPLSGSPTGTFSIQNLVVSGSILPSSTGTLDIGSPTQRFGTIYVNEAKLSTNTLYIGDTPILGTSMDTVLIKADPNQSINMSTRGTGSTLVTSEKNVSIQTTGLNADVNIQANGTGSKVRFGASQTIDFTAPEVVTYGNQTVSGNHSVGGNLTITGNLTVNGSQTTINATTVTTKDNIILVNSGEVGSGVTSGKAGIQVDRGDEVDYQIIFDEVDDLFKVGMVGQLETIASRPWVSANYSLNTHTHADATASVSGLMSAANFTKLAGIEANANNYSHPTGDGNLHVPATGTTNSKKLLMAGSAAGSLSWSFVDWADIQNKPSTYAPSAHTHGDADLTAISWTKVTGKPTTLSGYGITDAVNVSEVATVAAANKLLKLDAASKLPASITGNADGNAATATKLETARTLSVSGDATGSATFDGSANSNIALTLANVVTAGTAAKVTFNAKGLITGTSSLTASDIPNLDWSKITSGKPTTLSGYGITDAQSLIATGTTAQYYRGDKTWATLDKAAVGLNNVENTALSTWAGSSNLTTAGALTAASLTVTGNLTVSGTTTTVNSTVVAIDDPVMTLGGDTAPTTDDGKDRGIEFRWHNGTAAKVGFFGFDDSTGKLTFIPDATNTSEVFSGTKGTIDAYLAWSDVTGKPTTVSGFGITDAMTTAHAANSITGFGTSGAATTVARSDHNHTGVYQPLDGDLTAIAGLTGTSGLLKKTAADTWTLDTNTYLTGNQSITVSGDASGSGTTAISLTLANVVTAGTATKVTYDAKGRVTAGASLAASDIPNLDWSKITSGKPTTLSGYGITDGVNTSDVVTVATANKLLKLDANSKLPASITGNADGNAATATKLATARSIAMTGDVSWSISSFDGSGNVTAAATLANVVTAGTGTKVTYNAKGLVTGSAALAASDIPSLDWSKITTGKPTTLSGYGITDAAPSSHVSDAAVHLTTAQNAFLDAFVTGGDVVLDANVTF